MPQILITRPETASEHLANRLKRLGYGCCTEPMLSIEPMISARPGGSPPEAVMITSGNALEGLAKNGGARASLSQLPCFCVGERTAEKARVAGFHHVICSQSDGLELARLISGTLGPSQRILWHVTGLDFDSKAKDELERSGFSVATWPVYAAHPAEALSPETGALLRQGRLDAVLVFSVRTAETLLTLLQREKLETSCEHMLAIGLSEAVAAVLKSLPWLQLTIAAAPSEDAVITRLQDILPAA